MLCAYVTFWANLSDPTLSLAPHTVMQVVSVCQTPASQMQHGGQHSSRKTWLQSRCERRGKPRSGASGSHSTARGAGKRRSKAFTKAEPVLAILFVPTPLACLGPGFCSRASLMVELAFPHAQLWQWLLHIMCDCLFPHCPATCASVHYLIAK